MESLDKSNGEKKWLRHSRIGFIGSGKMAKALVHGFLRNNKISLENPLWVSGRSKGSVQSFLEEFEGHKIHTTLDNRELVHNTDLVFLCVKPPQAKEVLGEIRAIIASKVLISVVAGLTIKDITQLLSPCMVIRAMPNLPCQIGKGVIPYALNRDEDRKNREMVSLIHYLFSLLGHPIQISEDLMAAATALVGCGPAYVCMLMIGLIEQAKAYGFPDLEAIQLMNEMVLGTLSLLMETKRSPEKLLSEVKTPRGITEAATQVMVRKGWEDILLEAIEAAKKKAETLEVSFK
ncbi:pyrroline-5-carboxylate reductase [Methylacidiphilum sp. Yel]|uniref:pyrroline-5-carboxylate reductase n=1 Tax=Methylacidiphilum sp. Yel TaxID=1847730 RepID=UPI00106AFC60|nr:pyrroline-5-carboxylate reductase [Methylacidiphilum sp. Yel]TFE67329.1 pyrroline-5-carboxylate reductase [Methylacidiphilum sp. Yel]